MAKNASGRIPVDTTEHNADTELYNFARFLQGRALSEFNFIRFVVHTGKHSALDKHAVKEYWYIARGEGLLKIDEEEIPVKEGELYFFDSYSTHSIKNTSATENLEILSVWW